MPDETGINTRLRTARIAKFGDYKGQRALCRVIGLSFGTYNNYESGYSRPKYETIRRIAKACEVSETWLVSGCGEMRGADDARAAGAIAEAVEHYGPNARIDTIRGAAMDVLLKRLEAQDQMLRERDSKIAELTITVNELRREIDALKARLNGTGTGA